jgi:RHS repeat-associated protein
VASSFVPTFSATASETLTYTYDARGRLVKVARSGTVNNGVSACYAYDKADNRSNVTVATSSDCATPPPSFAINDVAVTEGGSLSFTVTKTGSTSSSFSVNYGSANGTATAGSDYTATSGMLTFAAADAICWRPVWHRDALGRQTDFVWNSDAQLIEQTDPADQNGVRRKTIHDYADSPAGIHRRTVTRTCGVGTTCGVSDETRTEVEYWGDTDLPTLVRQIDPATGETRVTTFTYDNAGRVLSVDGPLAGTDDTQYFRYDVYGRKTWEIGARGPNNLHLAKRTTYRDSDDKVTAVEMGTLTSPTDTNLIVFERSDTSYNSKRHAIRETRSAGGTTYAVTDKSFLDRGLAECTAIRMNLAALPAAGGACVAGTEGGSGPDRIVKNIYDNAGQLIQLREGVGVSGIEAAEATYSYTSNGKRNYIIDANGNRAQLSYDGHDRQVKWIFPSTTRPASFNDATQATALSTAGAVNAADYEQYGYNAAGNRTSLRKRDGSTLTYSYDALNRMIVKVVPSRSGLTAAQTRDVYYDYDLKGLMTKARFDSLSGEGITSSYNGFGELKTSQINLGGLNKTLSYAYDLAGKRTELTQADGQKFSYKRDTLGRVSNLYEGTTQTSTYQLIASTFDNRGLIDTMERAYSIYGFTADFTFDAVGRLSSIFNDAPGTASDLTITQTFNPASQIASQTRSNDAYAWTGSIAVNRNYTTNGLNQYSAAGPASFSYDANGNLTSDGSTTYLYDIENRLVSASGATTAGLVYDPMGRLFQVTGPTTNTRFLYDGDELIAEYDSAGTMARRYVHSDNVDDPVVQYDSASVGASYRTFLMPDERGSIVGLFDNGGTSIAKNSYDEYGIPATTTPGASVTGRFAYTGQIWLPELGMYHYKARLYSPTLGRFLQVDPIGYEGGIALYAYVENDPVNMADPSGLMPGDPYDSADAAAADALAYINPISISQNREYIGLIEFRNGSYYATDPVKGSIDMTHSLRVTVTPRLVGWYHTHGDYTDAQGRRTDRMHDDPARNSDNFAPQDYQMTEDIAKATKNPNVNGYLGTPSRTFRAYNAGTNKERVLRKSQSTNEQGDRPGGGEFWGGGLVTGPAARGSRIGCEKGQPVC